MGQDDKEEKQERRDFFISYTGQDKPWAEWIATQLDAAGYTFFFQAWDFRPGSNFVAEMDNATRLADRTLLVLSAAYLASGFAFSEWAAAFRQDPKGCERRLLPVRIEPCELNGLLAQVGYLDLVGYDAEQAKERLLAGIQTGRVRPAHVPFPGQQITSVAFPGAFPAIWNIPFARNPFFTGREDLLEQLHTQLHTTIASAISQPQAISGLGGIGKTQLAIEYAYRYRGEYQAILWARADTTEALNASYSDIARLLQLPQQEAQEQDVIVQAVKQWLRQKHGWLLILDNVDDLNQVQAFVPTGVPGHLILTTKTHITGKVAKRLEVDTLDAEVGALLLLRRAGLLTADASLETASVADQALARVLTRELGGLPLALDQAGAYIEETECSLSDYQQQYQMRRAELLARRGALVDDHPESVATTWSLAFAQVEQANPIAAELLWACAFLAPDAIPEELLVEVLQTPLSSSESPEQPQKKRGDRLFWLTSRSRQKQKHSHAVKSKEAIREAIAVLRVYSLIQRNTVERTVLMHRLVQAVVRSALEEQEQIGWMIRVICAVNELFPDGEFDTWKQCMRYLPQAFACNAWIAQENLKLLEGAFLVHRAAYYLADRAQYEAAELLYKQALAICEQELGANHSNTVKCLNNLAGLYYRRGKYAEAEPLLKRALTTYEQELQANQPDMAHSLNNLALLYSNQGKYAEAEPLLKRALAIYEQESQANHPNAVNTLNNLARLYHMQGKYAKAEPLYEQVLAMREQELKANQPDMANSLNNLGLLYADQRKYAAAEPLLKRALAIREQELGATHPDTASSLNNLANLYMNQQKLGEAELLLKRALAIREQELGATHPDTASSLNNLARLYYVQGRDREAEPLYHRALAIRERELGAEHPDTAQSLNNLAASYERQGKYKEAELLLERALAIRKQKLGAWHSDTTQSLNNLARLYSIQGKYREAEPLYKQVLAMREQELGVNHPDIASSLNNLADLYAKQEKYAEAESLYERALAMREQALGPEDSHTLLNLYRLISLSLRQQHYQKAKSFYERTLTIVERTLGSEHLHTQDIRKGYTTLLHAMKQNETTSS